VIVLVGGIYYIVSGAFLLLPVFFEILGFPSGSNTLSFIFAPVFIGIGAGLLKRKPAARWTALGVTLVGWTVGSVLLVYALYYFFGKLGLELGDFMTAVFSKGLFTPLARVALFSFLLWVAGIVIAFKLFWYLWSEEGCEEFGVQHGDLQDVITSTAVWLAFWFGSMFATLEGRMGLQAVKMAWNYDPDERRQQQARASEEQRIIQQKRDMAMREQRLQLEQARLERERRAREAQDRAILEAAERQEQLGDSPDYHDRVPRQQAQAAEFEVPGNYGGGSPAGYGSPAATATQEEEEPDSRKILKCRDASGSITFTQSYCPAGTQPVTQ
jgi:hypothetical protein